jgi:hypothetical protein
MLQLLVRYSVLKLLLPKIYTFLIVNNLKINLQIKINRAKFKLFLQTWYWSTTATVV